jgi:hypothetical protein
MTESALTAAGLTVVRIGVAWRSPARAIPVPPGVKWEVHVYGRVGDDGRIDEADTVRRMGEVAGHPPERTVERPDGYWWYVQVGDVLLISTRMVTE